MTDSAWHRVYFNVYCPCVFPFQAPYWTDFRCISNTEEEVHIIFSGDRHRCWTRTEPGRLLEVRGDSHNWAEYPPVCAEPRRPPRPRWPRRRWCFAPRHRSRWCPSHASHRCAESRCGDVRSDSFQPAGMFTFTNLHFYFVPNEISFIFPPNFILLPFYSILM